MANCMTCRHNDKKAKYCPVKKAHTDLGYVLNCIAWAPTDEAEMKRFRAENAKLRELVRDMWEGYYDPRCEECHLKDTPTCADCPICAREASVIDRMRELGVEVVMDERRRS